MPTRKNVDSITRTNNLKLTDFSFSNAPVSREGLKSLTLKSHFKRSFYHKLTSSFLIFAMLFQVIGGVFLSVPAEEAQASPFDWLTGYNYRTPVLIDNNTETLTDYQTKIILQGTDPTAPNYIDFDKVLPNGADLRITDSDKVTQIPYWIESWDDAAKTAKVWTKIPTIPISSSVPPYYNFSTSSTAHNDYGLSYPVTYEFNIPAGSSDLKAYKKYTEAGSWTQIEEKTSTDFFNGIEAVRFNYSNNKAYVSVAFDANSNDIYLKVINGSDIQVGAYQTIDKYYDNRKAAVTTSGDDWTGVSAPFSSACDMFTVKHIWFTSGIETASGGTPMSQAGWDSIQSKIDAGYIEPASHTRIHQQTAYTDTVAEVDGSKNDLLNNLNFPSLNKKRFFCVSLCFYRTGRIF